MTVFDHFYRPEDSRSRNSGGNGSRLAIVRSVIEAHHGTVTLQKSRGAGAAFTIRLPIAARDDAWRASNARELEAT
jgi:signal transduction histidine kinase